jgi:hypothetical protein
MGSHPPAPACVARPVGENELIWMNKSLSSAAISRGGLPDNAVAMRCSAVHSSPHSLALNCLRSIPQETLAHIARDTALRCRTDLISSASKTLAISVGSLGFLFKGLVC